MHVDRKSGELSRPSELPWRKWPQEDAKDADFLRTPFLSANGNVTKISEKEDVLLKFQDLTKQCNVQMFLQRLISVNFMKLSILLPISSHFILFQFKYGETP